MQVVVRAGGKQYRVEEGAVVAVPHLTGEPGNTVTFRDVLLVADGDKLTVGGATVTGEIVAHEKGDKIRVLKYKNKTRYRKISGQREQTTKIKITKIEAEA
jgi:large subunit ribosomal protein L21